MTDGYVQTYASNADLDTPFEVSLSVCFQRWTNTVEFNTEAWHFCCRYAFATETLCWYASQRSSSRDGCVLMTACTCQALDRKQPRHVLKHNSILQKGTTIFEEFLHRQLPKVLRSSPHTSGVGILAPGRRFWSNTAWKSVDPWSECLEASEWGEVSLPLYPSDTLAAPTAKTSNPSPEACLGFKVLCPSLAKTPCPKQVLPEGHFVLLWGSWHLDFELWAPGPSIWELKPRTPARKHVWGSRFWAEAMRKPRVPRPVLQRVSLCCFEDFGVWASSFECQVPAFEG